MGVYSSRENVIHCWCIIGNSVETGGNAFRSFWANQRPASGWGVGLEGSRPRLKRRDCSLENSWETPKATKSKRVALSITFSDLDITEDLSLYPVNSTGTLWRKGVLSNKQLFCLRLSITPYPFPASAAKSTSGKQWDLWRRVSFAAVIKIFISSLGS